VVVGADLRRGGSPAAWAAIPRGGEAVHNNGQVVWSYASARPIFAEAEQFCREQQDEAFPGEASFDGGFRAALNSKITRVSGKVAGAAT
jgi:hypothetical protein